MTAVIDYGVGNLFSLKSSLKHIGAASKVVSDPGELALADRLILPGVGAFRDASDKLRQSGMEEALLREVKKGKPILGICLGMQLLFQRSFEYGEHKGLGLIRGDVAPIRDMVPAELKIPQMGWNALHFPEDREKCAIFRYIDEGEHMYFVHSYAGVHCEEALAATTEYGVPLTAAVAKDHVFGCQFHPEKSGDRGLLILKAFCEL